MRQKVSDDGLVPVQDGKMKRGMQRIVQVGDAISESQQIVDCCRVTAMYAQQKHVQASAFLVVRQRVITQFAHLGAVCSIFVVLCFIIVQWREYTSGYLRESDVPIKGCIVILGFIKVLKR